MVRSNLAAALFALALAHACGGESSLVHSGDARGTNAEDAGAAGEGPACDPSSEHQRRYIGLGAECPGVEFRCYDPTTVFWNDCGCGCEEDPNCPEVFDCSPRASTPCTPEELAHCPFSRVLE